MKHLILTPSTLPALLALIFLIAQPATTPAQGTNLDFNKLLESADSGDALAQYQVAERYAAGQGVVRDYHTAAQYLQKSASRGNVDAEIALGSLYGRGRGVPRSVAMAVHWYQKAADQGSALAEFTMGNFYFQGRGVTNDVYQAAKWWRLAADQNQVNAQAALGELYLIPNPSSGTNLLNYPEGLRLLRLAAAQGSVPAINNLGAAYESGIGVKFDFKEAAHWYQMAADRGDALAQGNLGQLYFDGRGVPFDLEQAYKWFKLSSNQGQVIGIKGLDNFKTYHLLTPSQLAEAEQMVSNYRPILTKDQP